MRPLQLTITAFGPYATQQVIDFTQLQGRNLFVITGDTGAGKTTILDAIAYSLYGRASGRDRDGENLRSHFAKADLLTAVELEFELKGERYWVKRIPKQRKKRTRGEGYTDQNAEAEFKNLDGESKLTTGVKEVNEKIVELMGLSYDQFKQIIMIPQGEFRELLNADSKARQDILQKIFGTEGLRRIQDSFDYKAKALSQEISILENQRNECIRSLDGSDLPLEAILAVENYNVPLVVEEAKKAIEIDENLVNDLQMQIDEQEKAVAAKQHDIFKGKADNLTIRARDEAQQKQIALQAGQTQIDERKNRLQQGRKALGLQGVEEYRCSRDTNVKKRKIELAKAEQQENDAKVDVDRKQTNYQLEVEKESKRNELLTEQARLKGLAGKVADWDERQITNSELENQLIIVKRKRDHHKIQLEQMKEEIKECQSTLDAVRVTKIEYARKAVQLEKVNTIYEKMKIWQEQRTRQVTLQQAICGLKQRQVEEELTYEKARADYEEAQHLFLAGQASLLAVNLQAGDACPVCGSPHHPKLATLQGNIPSESQLKKLIKSEKEARKLYDDVKDNYERVRADEYAQNQIVARLAQELGVMVEEELSALSTEKLAAYMLSTLAKYQQQQELLMEEIKKLTEQNKDEEQLTVTLGEKVEMSSKLSLELANIEEEYTTLFAKAQSSRDAMKVLETELPQEIRSLGKLAEKLVNVEKEFGALKQALAVAQEQCRESQLHYASIVAEEKTIAKALQEGQAELQIAEERFREALADAGFEGETDYDTAKLTESKITSLEKEINIYQEELRSAMDHYAKCQQAVEGLVPVDVIALESEHLKLQMTKTQLIDQRTVIVARKTHNQTMLQNIASIVEKLGCKEEEHQVIGHLARIARGDNEQKVSFERYVLAAFFNDIIDAANARLKKMTGGRYQMSRITQKGKGGGQTGLEIEVFDYYTGQSRHVKTLSGGESFKASLALALGLAEVVQSYAGGISLETMFVDEGFGTLDPESLDTAIGCLIDLQHSGRLVGIISHVPELKSSIDARLEIEACQDGSQARFCIQ